MIRPGVTRLALFIGLAAGAAAHGGGFDRAISMALPRVVKLYGLGAGLQAGYGTGVIVSADGRVLTVFSLLIDARRIRAVTAEGTTYGATVLFRDAERQLALLQLTPPVSDEVTTDRQAVGPFPFFDISREQVLHPGDWVLAAGNAFKVAEGAEPVSAAHGVFSTRTRLDARRRLKDFPYRGDVLVIDAITSNPGAPGSALVNLDGVFVGMIGRVVMSNLTHTHFNYAIPRDVLAGFLDDAEAAESGDGTDALRSLAAVLRMRSTEDAGYDPGIRLSRVGYRTKFPFVDRVRVGSPAQLAGVRRDDLIMSVNGRSVYDVGDYEARRRTFLPDEPIDLVVRRGRKIINIRVEPEKP